MTSSQFETWLDFEVSQYVFALLPHFLQVIEKNNVPLKTYNIFKKCF